MSGYVGFGYLPRCPNCGSANVMETDAHYGRSLLCGSCGEPHERDAHGTLYAAPTIQRITDRLDPDGRSQDAGGS